MFSKTPSPHEEGKGKVNDSSSGKKMDSEDSESESPQVSSSIKAMVEDTWLPYNQRRPAFKNLSLPGPASSPCRSGV